MMDNTGLNLARRDKLIHFAKEMDNFCRYSNLLKYPVPLERIKYVIGARIGSLQIDAGLDTGRLLRLLGGEHRAILRNIIPRDWDFKFDPEVYMDGRYMRIDVDWPDELIEKDIGISSLSSRLIARGERLGLGEYIAGLSDNDDIVAVSFDVNPQQCVAGMTGQGKTELIRSVVFQLGHDRRIRIVLIDMKGGENGLRFLERVPGVIGPVVMNNEAEAKKALTWVLNEAKRRNALGIVEDRIIVVVDEIQKLCIKDSDTKKMLDEIAETGRSAGVHLIFGVQNPTKESLGDRRMITNCSCRIALKVMDSYVSRAILGEREGFPSASSLTAPGDAFVATNKGIKRVQLAMVHPRQIDTFISNNPWQRYFDAWPEPDYEGIAQLPEPSKVYKARFSGEEMAIALFCHYKKKSDRSGYGRGTIQEMMKEAGFDGYYPDLVREIQKVAGEQFDALKNKFGVNLCETD